MFGWYIAIGAPLLLLAVNVLARRRYGPKLQKAKPTPRTKGSGWVWLFRTDTRRNRTTVGRRASEGGGQGGGE